MAFSYKPYEESEAVKRARENLANIESQRPAEWTGGTYGSQLKDAYDRINNREKFNYDFNADALYRQYKDQYMRQGLMAMQDAQAQSAALTGGFGNSYAVTAGNLAYQDYLSRINGVIPELQDAAFQRYQAEGDDMADAYDRLRGLYNTEYGEYQDRLNVFNNERNYLYNLAQDLAKDDYDRYNDEYARALNLYNMNNSSSGGSGGGGGGRGKDPGQTESHWYDGLGDTASEAKSYLLGYGKDMDAQAYYSWLQRKGVPGEVVDELMDKRYPKIFATAPVNNASVGFAKRVAMTK